MYANLHHLGQPVNSGFPDVKTRRKAGGICCVEELLLAPESFSAVFLNWTQSLRQAVEAKIAALDGKTGWRSFDSAKSQSAIHPVSAWASTNRLALGSIKVPDKSNEITAVSELLRALELAGGHRHGGRAERNGVKGWRARLRRR